MKADEPNPETFNIWRKQTQEGYVQKGTDKRFRYTLHDIDLRDIGDVEYENEKMEMLQIQACKDTEEEHI